METVIDRTSYRRSNIKDGAESKDKKRNRKLKKLVLNEIIISMSIIISILVIKMLNLNKAYDWLNQKINTGIPFEILSANVLEKIDKFIFDYSNVAETNIFDINVGEEGLINNSGENLLSNYERTNTSILSGDDIVEYETAVEGVNQLSEDAKAIKENYKLIMPTNGTITSKFGCREDDNPIVSSYHVGLDIASNTGTKIIASHDGEIIEAGTIGTYGKCIMIQNDNLITLYAHCSQINVSKGSKIKQGEKIGEIGMTGNATGPHLHFEVRYEGRYVNPEEVI